ncbi:hypothetical protein MW887_009908 [Aspergillus wentii]|nr:hypothetical protein MW887_009908 [Aspergillus wentii]
MLTNSDSFALPTAQPESDSRLPDASHVLLRTMPLGASITYGTKSTDGNGFRKAFHEKLREAGHPVDMVGSRKAGTMKDNDNEGWPGFTVDQVHKKASANFGPKPNLYLIEAGTNDCVKEVDVAHARERMENMINDIFTHVPSTTIILSGLLPLKKNDTCAQEISAGYKELVGQLQEKKKKIVFADMHNGQIKLSDLVDGTHPTDAGYKTMAEIWFSAFQDAAHRNFLTAPLSNS